MRTWQNIHINDDLYIEEGKKYIKEGRQKKFGKKIYNNIAWDIKGGDDLHTTMNKLREKINFQLHKFIHEDKNIEVI